MLSERNLKWTKGEWEEGNVFTGEDYSTGEAWRSGIFTIRKHGERNFTLLVGGKVVINLMKDRPRLFEFKAEAEDYACNVMRTATLEYMKDVVA